MMEQNDKMNCFFVNFLMVVLDLFDSTLYESIYVSICLIQYIIDMCFVINTRPILHRFTLAYIVPCQLRYSHLLE